jgi:hypothetical protein
METVLTVSELLPAAVEPSAMSELDRRDYEAGLDAFLDGRWQDATELLRRLPGDEAARLLRNYMERHGRTPPPNWDGVVVLETK